MAEEQRLPVKEERKLTVPGFAFVPQTWEQLYSYAKEISTTEFVPKSFQNKPGAVLAAWQKGQEVGLPPMAALESICVINGRTSIHSDGYWMLVVSHPLCQWAKELPPEEALAKGYGECTIQRRGYPEPITRRFSIEEAKTANLLEKDNWKHYRGRMLQQRARHRCGSDAIPEATGGLLPADIATDYDLETTATTVKEEPLKIPQAIKEEGNGQETRDLLDARSATGAEETPLAGTRETPPVSLNNKEKSDDTTPVETKTRDPKKKTPAEVKEDILDWIANRGTKEEILALQNYATENMKGNGLSSNDLMAISREWNLRRKKLSEQKGDDS